MRCGAALKAFDMSPAQFIVTLAVALAVTAAFTDVRYRRIPNRLTYPLMVIGLLAQTAFHGWGGLVSALEGSLLFGGIFLVFYLIRAMGAGDVKLAAALGCIVGPSASLQVMFATAMAGGVLAVLYIVASRRIVETVRNTFSVVGFHVRHGLQPHPIVNLDNPSTVRMPYGLAFAAGTLYWAVPLLFWR
jgi:prepilin peptidase CpaA